MPFRHPHPHDTGASAMRRCGHLLLLIALAGAWGCAATGPARFTPRERVIHGQVTVSAGDHAKPGVADLSEAIVYIDRIPEPAAPPPRQPAARNVPPLQKTPPSPPARSTKPDGKRAPPPRNVPPSSAGPQAAPAPEIVARGDGFSPRVLVVVAGTRVTFRNTDRIYHSTFSVSRAKKFDLGTYAPGQRRTVVFDRPGVVDLFCGLHPRTSGFIVVVPNPFYAHAKANGAFSLAPLPPGRYTVRVWHPRYGERKATVDLTSSADADLMVKF